MVRGGTGRYGGAGQAAGQAGQAVGRQSANDPWRPKTRKSIIRVDSSILSYIFLKKKKKKEIGQAGQAEMDHWLS